MPLEIAEEPIETRIAYIQKSKPADEITVRLCALRPVRSVLPQAIVVHGKTIQQMARTSNALKLRYDSLKLQYDSVSKQYEDALNTYSERDYEPLWRAKVQIWNTKQRVMSAWLSALRKYDDAKTEFYQLLTTHYLQIMMVYRRECWDVPWTSEKGLIFDKPVK